MTQNPPCLIIIHPFLFFLSETIITAAASTFNQHMADQHTSLVHTHTDSTQAVLTDKSSPLWGLFSASYSNGLSFFFFSQPITGLTTAHRAGSPQIWGQWGNINWPTVPPGWDTACNWNSYKLFMCLIRQNALKLFSQQDSLCAFPIPFDKTCSQTRQCGWIMKIRCHNDEIAVFWLQSWPEEKKKKEKMNDLLSTRY